MATTTSLTARRRRNVAQALVEKGWFHSFELPDGRLIDGVLSLERLRARLARFGIPEDLRGKRVLDIGAWDGWFSFEMERRGAEVLAVDCVEIENFRRAHQLLGSKVEYRILDLFELSPETIGRFDIVLFLGVLYHLRHPLLGLETVAKLTKEMAIVESFVADDGTAPTELPYMEFYETDELGGQLDNWFGPTVDCLLGLCRAAGFARVELRGADNEVACVACYRQWEPEPATARYAAPLLADVHHCRNYGINFNTRRDDYLACVFATEESDLKRENICVEIGEYGAAPIWIGRTELGRWQANCMLPPGIAAGWHDVRVRTVNSRYSNSLRVAVDLPIVTDKLVLGDACDSISWEKNLIRNGLVTFWISGLPDHADRNNVRVRLGESLLPVQYISPLDENGFRQLNAGLPPEISAGQYDLFVRFGDTESVRIPLQVKTGP